LSEFNLVAIKGQASLAQSKFISNIDVIIGSQKRNEVSQSSTKVQSSNFINRFIKMNSNHSPLSRDDKDMILLPDSLIDIAQVSFKITLDNNYLMSQNILHLLENKNQILNNDSFNFRRNAQMIQRSTLYQTSPFSGS
jgi:hypothetical protein